VNCSECGHSVDKHAHWGDCLEKQCSCHNTPDKIRIAWFETEIETTQARLTLTEAALSAAGELLSMSTAENNYLSAFSTCDICNAPTWSGHEETCEYRIAKERYQAAREALNGDETK